MNYINSIVNVILGIAKPIVIFINESARLSATFNAQQKGLQNLAASFGQSGSAIQTSKDTLSDSEILSLSVAKTPEEFDKFRRAALAMEHTVKLTAEQSIGKFTTEQVIDVYISRMARGKWEIINQTDKGIQIKEVKKVKLLGIIVGIALVPFWGIGFVMLLLVLIDYALQREKVKFITVNQMIKQLKATK